MDSIENNLCMLLDGLALQDSEELCDFSLADQNEAIAAKGVTPSTPSDFVPVVKNTVTYIVMAVLFNEEGEILMMQEAKSSCAGQWYLPAGRMEPGEDIEAETMLENMLGNQGWMEGLSHLFYKSKMHTQPRSPVQEAVKREVLEETGLHMVPTSLIMVQCASKAWFRFVLAGRVTGGTLKTPAQADSESLQAKWVKDPEQMSLRCKDILPVVERGHQFRLRQEPQHPTMLPAVRPHHKLLLRFVVLARQKSSNRVHILLSEKTEVHLPICEVNHHHNLHSTIRKFMVEIFGADVPPHKPHGVLSVEHCGKPEGTHDGLLLTILIAFRVPLEQVFPIDKYTWLMVGGELGDKLIQRVPRNMTVPLHVIS